MQPLQPGETMTTRPGGRPGGRRTSTQRIDAPEQLLGRVLDGRFRLDEVLNAGGMGIIFRGTQLSVGRQVAVKLLKPTLASESELMRRFSREVDVISGLAHPNIVAFIDAGRDAGGLMYLVMEYVEGKTFRESLQAGEMTLLDILEVFGQICDALIEAHGRQIIHRDLKFDNVMIVRQRDGRLHAKVLDFGVAKLLGEQLELTRKGQIPGTPGIIAPELAETNDPSARSDLYSLGVLLFTALTGQPPFTGRNDFELMEAHRTEPVPELSELVQEYVPESVRELIYSLLAKLPEDRPESAQQVRDRLEQIVKHTRQAIPFPEPYIPPTFGDAFDEALARAKHTAVSRSMEMALAKDHKPEKESAVAPTSIVMVLFVILLVLVAIIFRLLVELFRGPGVS